jgi:hypothetical protein
LRKRRLPARWPTSSFAFQSVNICEAEDEESISPATSADLAAEGNKTRVPAQDAREVVDVSPLGVHGSVPLVTNGQAASLFCLVVDFGSHDPECTRVRTKACGL